MSSLMGNVRSLHRQAGDLRESDTNGLNLLRKQVSETLKQFDSISKAAGGDTKFTEDKAAADKIAAMSARELKATLTDMQTNLRGNFRTISSGVQKAIAYGSQYSASSSSSANSPESLAALWDRLYGSGKTANRRTSSYL